MLEKLRYNFRLADSTNGKFKAAFIHIGEVVCGKSDAQKSQSTPVGAYITEGNETSKYSAQLHADAFLQAERLNIMTDVLLSPTKNAKKAARGKLISAAVRMLEDALSAIGDIAFVVIDIGGSTPDDYMRRAPITFEKVDAIAIEVAENRNRNASLGKISKTLKCMPNTTNYEEVLRSAISYGGSFPIYQKIPARWAPWVRVTC